MVSRLLAGVTVVLFSVWFVLPCCHCQWDGMFGEPSIGTGTALPSLVGSVAGRPIDCHCDEHASKAFDQAPETAHSLGLHEVAFVSLVWYYGYEPGCVVEGNLNRGPPPGVDLTHFGESRAYVRHRSLLL